LKKKKKKKRRALAHYAEYAFLRLVVFTCGGLSARWRMRLARMLGWTAAHFVPFRRRRALENLRIAFPDWEESDRSKLLPMIYAHQIAFGLEMAALSRLAPEEVGSNVVVPIRNGEVLEELRRSGKGFMIVCGHMGNWEWLAAYLVAAGYSLGGVAKPLHNPLTQRFVGSLRSRFGIRVFSTRGIQREMIRHLKAGGMLGLASDQDARRKGIFVPFFGREASTPIGAAWLAQRLGLPLLPIWVYRTPEGRFILECDEPIEADPSLPADAEIERLTRYHVEGLERAIRKDPAQYLWFHRRWKTRPKAEAADS